MGNLTPELARYAEEIRELASGYGLDFYETIFELVDWDELNMVAAYGGFPKRYPHWRFGMEFEQLQKSYTYGLSKIYELVINNDPCYAYLMRANSLTDQKLVMAHVYGHCDFFKNNAWFAHTNRKMMDAMANHGARVRRYMDQFGVDIVEDFIDSILSLDNLIDIHSPYIQRKDPKPLEATSEPPRLKAKGYMDRYINPPEVLATEAKQRQEKQDKRLRFPSEPAKDVLLFLLHNAPLERWQQDVLAMLREEAYYFAPQAMTKIMNEGWAVFWHSTMMCKDLVEPAEVIDYCDHHSGTLATSPGQINPYKIGVELFRDIEDRWNRGKFGLEFQRIESGEERRRYDKNLGLGKEKIFQVRKVYNDVTFIDEYLNEEFAEEQKLFVYGFNKQTRQYEIVDRDYRKVKEQLLWSLTNFGQPRISVVDANFRNRGELYLFHDWSGVDLQFQMARETLTHLQKLWGRPVHIETKEEGEGRLLSFDGEQFTVTDMAPTQAPPDLVAQEPDNGTPGQKLP
jgi:stage V sporulation protein R